MKVYGIKTCGSVKKALKFFKDKIDIDTLFNKRGTKYRQLKLKELNLDDEGKKKWLCKENILIKRPVIELDNGDVIVGFDEEKYKEIRG